jgi:hypothetical protein
MAGAGKAMPNQATTDAPDRRATDTKEVWEAAVTERKDAHARGWWWEVKRGRALVAKRKRERARRGRGQGARRESGGRYWWWREMDVGEGGGGRAASWARHRGHAIVGIPC